MKIKIAAVVTILVMTGVIGCGPDTGSSFGELMDQGWVSFEAGEYDAANDLFIQAQQLEPGSSEVFSALGWTRLKQNDLISAADQFQQGSVLAEASADLFAGYAFVRNAQKIYDSSNASVSRAMTLDPVWTFTHIPALDIADLHLVKAENHYALGQFALALNEVKILSPGFNVDVTTYSGQSQLADKIESLKVGG